MTRLDEQEISTFVQAWAPLDRSAPHVDAVGFLDQDFLLDSEAINWDAALAVRADPELVAASADAVAPVNSLPPADHAPISDGGILFHHSHEEPVGRAAPAEAAAASQTSANALTVVYSIPQIVSYLTQGYWQYDGQEPHHFSSGTITYNLNGFDTTAEKNLATQALQAWADVANISFVVTSGSAQITFTDNGNGSSANTSATLLGSLTTSAIITVTTSLFNTYGTQTDSYSYQTLIHEIGHALGLGHGGPYNGKGTYSVDAIYANDTTQYSVMSYFYQSNFGGASDRNVFTPQMADIAAVASLYGAATTTRTGTTVYGFHNNAGSLYDFSSYTTAPALTIFDSGGNDTLDCSGYSEPQTIDLTAGKFCSIGGLTNNVGIALGTKIENAVGGSGSDTIIGNSADNRLSGSAGADFMTGGSGDDLFVYASGWGTDTITDFTAGIGSVDEIDLSGYATISNFAAVLARATQVGSSTLISFSAIDTLTLLHVNRTDLSSNDFVFAGPGQSIVGTNGNDTLTGTGVDDVITGGAGNDNINGGAGNDTSVYLGSLDQYVVTKAGTSVTVTDSVSSRDGLDTVTNVEHLRFSDRSIDLTMSAKAATVSASQVESLVELYVAYCNRVPAASGLSYWIDKLKGGESLNDISKEFYAAGVLYSSVTGYTATMSNADFIKIVYANTLGRSGTTAPPAADVQYWDKQITEGATTKVGLIQTMLAAAHQYANDPTWGWVPQLLDKKTELGIYHAVNLGLDYNSPNEEITTTVGLAAAVTSNSTTTAVSLIGLVDHVFV